MLFDCTAKFSSKTIGDTGTKTGTKERNNPRSDGVWKIRIGRRNINVTQEDSSQTR
jgi:hypothetical protein